MDPARRCPGRVRAEQVVVALAAGCGCSARRSPRKSASSRRVPLDHRAGGAVQDQDALGRAGAAAAAWARGGSSRGRLAPSRRDRPPRPAGSAGVGWRGDGSLVPRDHHRGRPRWRLLDAHHVHPHLRRDPHDHAPYPRPAGRGSPPAGLVKDIHVGGVHMHHQVLGIFLVLVSALLEFAYQPGTPGMEILGGAFGVGAALTLDEFALWLHLDDVYWSKEGQKSIDAVVLGACLCAVLLIGTTPFGVDDTSASHQTLATLAATVLVQRRLRRARLPQGQAVHWAPSGCWCPSSPSSAPSGSPTRPPRGRGGCTPAGRRSSSARGGASPATRRAGTGCAPRSAALPPAAPEGSGQPARYWCTAPTASAPWPTAAATRLTEPARTSPAAKIPGTLVSVSRGSRSSGQGAGGAPRARGGPGR